jgi:hypothetical protein
MLQAECTCATDSKPLSRPRRTLTLFSRQDVRHASRATLVALTLVLALPTERATAQSLRGSSASVARPFTYAEKRDLRFHRTVGGVRRAVRRGRVVRLSGSADYRLRGVSLPYVRPATRAFVLDLARRYHAACGERLVVTSAIRPSSAQPANASPRSVHPTGIAVDLRRPRGRCLTWLRRDLLAQERRGRIEATEERRPAHFHVAVYATPRPQQKSVKSR